MRHMPPLRCLGMSTKERPTTLPSALLLLLLLLLLAPPLPSSPAASIVRRMFHVTLRAALNLSACSALRWCCQLRSSSRACLCASNSASTASSTVSSADFTRRARCCLSHCSTVSADKSSPPPASDASSRATRAAPAEEELGEEAEDIPRLGERRARELLRGRAREGREARLGCK